MPCISLPSTCINCYTYGESYFLITCLTSFLISVYIISETKWWCYIHIVEICIVIIEVLFTIHSAWNYYFVVLIFSPLTQHYVVLSIILHPTFCVNMNISKKLYSLNCHSAMLCYHIVSNPIFCIFC